MLSGGLLVGFSKSWSLSSWRDDTGTSAKPWTSRVKTDEGLWKTAPLVMLLALNPNTIEGWPPSRPLPQGCFSALCLGTNLDMSFAVTRIKVDQTYLTSTFGSEDAITQIAEDERLREARRIELLGLRRVGKFTESDAGELRALQAEATARLEMELEDGTSQLQRFLAS